MSSEQDPISIAKQAERDLNSHQAKQGHAGSTSTTESGIDESATTRFPGSTVTYGSAASGAGDNRDIPLSEGGDVDPVTGRLTKAKDFEGEGGPYEKAAEYAEENPGADDVRSNIRGQGVPELSGGGGHAPDVGARGAGKGTQ